MAHSWLLHKIILATQELSLSRLALQIGTRRKRYPPPIPVALRPTPDANTTSRSHSPSLSVFLASLPLARSQVSCLRSSFASVVSIPLAPPLVAILVDVTGLVIYFTVAKLILAGTLL